MNKKLVVGIIIALLLVVGGSLAYKKFGNTTPVQPNQTSEVGIDQNNTQTSLKSLLAQGSSQTCTFQNTEDYASSGTVYISDGKVRGDFTSNTEGNNMMSHVIVDNNTSYFWSDGQTSGFKTAFDINSTEDSLSTSSADSIADIFDSDPNLNYNCTTGAVDSSKFTVPAGIEFTDLNSQISSQCGVCDSLVDEAKSQCLTALGCY